MEFEDYLLTLSSRTGLKSAERAFVQETITRWKNGITPSANILSRLELLNADKPACARLRRDGSCTWLRMYGGAHGLTLPPVGEKAMCMFAGSFDNCHGYRKPSNEI